MRISILIPSLEWRSDMLATLVNHLKSQVTDGFITVEIEPQITSYRSKFFEIITFVDKKERTTGLKRQKLLDSSIGDYVIFIDDDDWVPEYYVEELIKAWESGADCFAINGIMTTDGRFETKWFISKDYENKDITNSGTLVYLRKTNHITAVKRGLAMSAGFPNKSNAEDKYYSDRLVLRTEYKIDKPMYHYRFSSKNKEY